MSDQHSRPKFRWHIIVFLAPAVLVYTAVMIYPLFNTLRLSLFTEVDQQRVFVGLQNFQTLFGETVWSNQFWNALGNNFWFFIIHMLVQNPIGVALAAILSHPKLRFASFYRSAIFIPTILSFVIVGFAWKLILGFNGVMNSALLGVGLIDEPLSFLLYNEFAVVLTLAHAWAPFAILPIYVSLQKIDTSLLEAATDLGNNAFQRFARITLPLTVPGIIAACLIIFIPTVGDYVTPALVGGSDGKMIANLIQVQFGAANNWPLGATLSLMAMLSVGFVAMVFVIASNRLGRRIR